MIRSYDNDDMPDLKVKFNVALFSEGITYGTVTLTETGEVDGTPLGGGDNIRVIFSFAGSRGRKR